MDAVAQVSGSKVKIEQRKRPSPFAQPSTTQAEIVWRPQGNLSKVQDHRITRGEKRGGDGTRMACCGFELFFRTVPALLEIFSHVYE